MAFKTDTLALPTLNRRHLLATAAAAAATGLSAGLATPALAQSWPAKPVTIVVPWPAGGPTDIGARPLAKLMQDALHQPFVIDNKGGSSGNIGAAMMLQAPADGHTLLLTSSATVVINPSLYKKMPFDPAKDLAPVTNVLRVPLVLVTHPSVPAADVKALLALIKAKPGEYIYASSGNGTPQHLTGDLFSDQIGVKMVHVPYKGSAPAIADLLAGHVPMMFDSLASIAPHIKSGKVKALAQTGARRSSLLPSVPTLAEAGLPGVETYAWYGLFAKAGTPPAVLQQINAEAVKAMKTPEFQQVLADTGSEFVGDTTANFATFVKAETEKWSRLVRQSGATID
ncbi:Bug family tripartite tricarboxylate transporter substrate binding protein [Ideonella livida]|uniref:Tripartite tricarboxylate transporter substrate binding protein n=1 Tax=Ideonella livida TaxID=2707176 RepID=A0A7C9TIX8_9BURK|nr:tripartite tricarboxylate transporter substrate binding protein [Ideonella livida]NDY90185.1 tripartite tricarboxylate transporter substrate binding protein [Ideonella livida]